MNRLRRPLLDHLIPTLSTITVLLILANLAGLVAKFHLGDASVHGWVPMFDLDGERNVPSVFSTGLIMLCSAAMALLAERDRPSNRLAWQGLSIIFVFLAADELISLHERLIEPVRSGLHTSGLLYLAWLIPYGLGCAVIGLAYLRFLLRLPRATRNGILTAAAIYLTGALELEALDGAYLESLHDVHNLPYELMTTLEEALEMAGMIWMLRVLLRQLTGARRRRSMARAVAASESEPRCRLA
ncbi:MAG: hypothetical protein FIA97_15480 [Methylococcaceae bacterium]|nr:hypothetical protein [Methylococcaceae bacterium]